jgi:anti-sigma B factor antagonist/stage II sporulation protein AA (anti-sigma F factor antagonist)
MDIEESRHGSLFILEPIGTVDESSAKELQQKATEVLAAGEKRIILDLHRADRVCGAGLRVLLTLNRKLASLCGGLVIASPNAEVLKSLRVAGLSRLLTTKPSRDEAIRHLLADETIERVTELAAELLASAERSDGVEEEDEPQRS